MKSTRKLPSVNRARQRLVSYGFTFTIKSRLLAALNFPGNQHGMVG